MSDISVTQVFTLLVVFQIKHFVCDFPLQTPYMLGKFKERGWLMPLAAHSGVHAFATFLICGFWNWSVALALALVDFAVHFTMDRVKASPNMLGKFKALAASEFYSATPLGKRHNKYFWWSLGLDQSVHHLTHYAIIALLVGLK